MSTEKTHIRIALSLELDAILQRALPELAGGGKAEARTREALRRWLGYQGFDVSTIPSPVPAVTGGGPSRRARPARAKRMRTPKARRPRRATARRRR